jgi:hypothetical protein
MQVQTITANAGHSAVENWRGFSVKEAAGTPAVASVTFRDGNGAGQILFELELAADESASIVFPDRILVRQVYVEVTAGTISGVLFHG